eukprot:GFYU01002357.1.p1 GENE.GFYU01002357.1~~GFYU01002357.1.p1  ORF type:complete len:177 (-),score=34.00 GFYU01002357.1:142-672(-)
MAPKLLFTIAIVCILGLTGSAEGLRLGKGDHRGFGQQYNWHNSLTEAQNEAKAANRPIMCVIHSANDQVSHNLKKTFAKSREIENLARKFVMLNLMDDEIPNEGMFPDMQKYVPKVVFLDEHLRHNKAIFNPASRHPQYRHFYADANQIIPSMKRANEQHQARLDAQERRRRRDEL